MPKKRFSADRHRAMTQALQHHPAALIARILATGTRGHRLARNKTNGANAEPKLTSQPDHSVGAGHFAIIKIGD
jgi:hypothetical protein